MPELEAHDLSAYGNSYASESEGESDGSNQDSQMSYYDKDADE
jgi:hypothetical protein